MHCLLPWRSLTGAPSDVSNLFRNSSLVERQRARPELWRWSAVPRFVTKAEINGVDGIVKLRGGWQSGPMTSPAPSYLIAAKLPDMRLHDLRHPCATLLLAQGVNPRVVMETLGHSQVSLTLNTYSHVLRATARRGGSDKRRSRALVCQLVCQRPVERPNTTRRFSNCLGTSGEPNVRELEPSDRLAAAAGGPPSCRAMPASPATGRHEGASSLQFALVSFVPPHGVITYGIYRV